MSLISLSSADNNHNASQQPFNFKNNFNQPIVIKPNSQVCLVNFYHFRDDELYNITTDNNRIGFNFGDPTTNGRWYAYLRPSTYTGNSLATELARALNEANIAFQNYTFSSTFTIGNRNANPPINDVFTITFASVTLPDTIGGSWTNFESVGNNTVTVDNTADDENVHEVIRCEPHLQVTMRCEVVNRSRRCITSTRTCGPCRMESSRSAD